MNSKVKIYIVIILIFVLSHAAGIAWTYWRLKPENFKVEYPLIDFSRNFIPQEHYLSTLQPLRDDLNELVRNEKEKGNEISLYLEYFNTGANISINNETRMLSASLIKVPIAMAAMKKIEDGVWKTDDKLALELNDIDANCGELYKEPVGTKFTVEFLIKAAVQNSDNTATNILLRNMTVGELENFLEYIGLDELFNEVGQISSKEYSRFFRVLYAASYLNREHSERLLEWLSQGSFDQFLYSGLAKGTVFSHKFGVNVNDRIFHDSGIVYFPDRPYLVTVLIQRSGESMQDDDLKETKRIMKEISEKAYKYISER